MVHSRWISQFIGPNIAEILNGLIFLGLLQLINTANSMTYTRTITLLTRGIVVLQTNFGLLNQVKIQLNIDV